MKARRCKNCLYAVKATGRTASVLVCINKPGSAGRLFLAEPKGLCRNFQTPHRPCRPKTPPPPNDRIRFIPLTKGKFAIVDTEDYQWLSKHKWHASEKASGFYACHHKNGKLSYMHREIINAPKHLAVDHIDGNPLNNRRSNLRLCSTAQNLFNRRSKRGKSKYKGVHLYKNKWIASIGYNGRHIYIGLFDNESDAAKAYDKKAAELFGQFAYLNFPEFTAEEKQENCNHEFTRII